MSVHRREMDRFGPIASPPPRNHRIEPHQHIFEHRATANHPVNAGRDQHPGVNQIMA